MFSAQPASLSRSAIMNLRALAFCSISFFIGLQFKSLMGLSGSGVGGAGGVEDHEAAWAPVDMREAMWHNRMSHQERTNVNDAETQTRGEMDRSTRRVKDDAEEQAVEINDSEMKDLEKERRRERRRRRRRRRAEKENENDSKASSGTKKKKKSVRYNNGNYTKDIEPLPWTLPRPTPMRDQTSEQFMMDYVSAKRKANIPLPWEQKAKRAEKPLTLPLPIISLNFPKSATLTMKAYFDCGGLTAIHTSTQDGRIAVCMMENHLNDRPPLHGCDTHKPRHTDDLLPIDFVSDIGSQGPPCYYPAVHDGGLENIARHYPSATILLVVRESTSWHRSMTKWGSIMHRWKKYCRFDARNTSQTANTRYWRDLYYSSSHQKANYWAGFYRAHTQKIRAFAMKHLTLTYVEVELGDDMGKLLERYTGVPASCVMDCHPGPKWIRQNNATSRCHPVGENPAVRDAKPEVMEEESDDSEEEEGEEDDDDDEVGTSDQEEDLDQ